MSDAPVPDSDPTPEASGADAAPLESGGGWRLIRQSGLCEPSGVAVDMMVLVAGVWCFLDARGLGLEAEWVHTAS